VSADLRMSACDEGMEGEEDAMLNGVQQVLREMCCCIIAKTLYLSRAMIVVKTIKCSTI